MADEKYQKALIELIREVLGEIIDDAVGLAEWKLRQTNNCMHRSSMVQENFHLIQVLHSAPFHLCSGSSPKTPSFNDLAGTQLTDEDTEKNQNDESLVKYLIGDISESEPEQENLPDPGVNSNLHENTNPHNPTETRTPMVPIDANIIVKTIDETKKNTQSCKQG